MGNWFLGKVGWKPSGCPPGYSYEPEGFFGVDMLGMPVTAGSSPNIQPFILDATTQASTHPDVQVYTAGADQAVTMGLAGYYTYPDIVANYSFDPLPTGVSLILAAYDSTASDFDDYIAIMENPLAAGAVAGNVFGYNEWVNLDGASNPPLIIVAGIRNNSGVPVEVLGGGMSFTWSGCVEDGA